MNGVFHDSVRFKALVNTVSLLAEVGDMRTADDLAKLISEEKEMDLCYPLLWILESIHGLPDSFERDGFVVSQVKRRKGDSTPKSARR